MRKEIEELREALESLEGWNEESEDALRSLEESIDEIDRHPASGRVRTVVAETASGARPGEEESSMAANWHALQDHLREWEDDHPTPVIVAGKVARALAVLGI